MKTSYILLLARKNGFIVSSENQNHLLLVKDENGTKCEKKTLILPQDEEIEEPLASFVVKSIKSDDEEEVIEDG